MRFLLARAPARFDSKFRGNCAWLPWLALAWLAWASAAAAQPPRGGLSPFAPPPAAPTDAAKAPPAKAPPRPSAPPAANLLAPAEDGPASAAPANPPGNAPLPPAPGSEPVLFVSEGLDSLLKVPELRTRLSEGLGRELVSLVDSRAHQARATVWIGLGPNHVVVRVTPPQRPEVWRQLLPSELGVDPIGVLVKAVLEMFWADNFARLDASELQDPFCPPGLICVDARRSYSWPPVPEPEVLDPWDTSYRRFYGWDPFSYPTRYPGSAALTPPYPGRSVRVAQPYWSQQTVDFGPRAREKRHPYALSFLSGGGVHKAGAFFRYEFNALRRFRRFDFGLAFIGARGQPEPPTKARRAITALLARRFIAEDFELDLGASFGTFFATFADHNVEVRPYLRGLVTFALPIGKLFDLLVQSDLATTFISVPQTGAVEYALSLGLRHRM
jgi:hypothetical protein